MTDTTTTVLVPAISSPPVLKSGYKSTEFYVTMAFGIVSMLVANGTIPTTGSGTFVTCTSIIATMLGALGYTVSRTSLKAGA